VHDQDIVQSQSGDDLVPHLPVRCLVVGEFGGDQPDGPAPSVPGEHGAVAIDDQSARGAQGFEAHHAALSGCLVAWALAQLHDAELGQDCAEAEHHRAAQQEHPSRHPLVARRFRFFWWRDRLRRGKIESAPGRPSAHA
jgi:hypothetical protein